MYYDSLKTLAERQLDEQEAAGATAQAEKQTVRQEAQLDKQAALAVKKAAAVQREATRKLATIRPGKRSRSGPLVVRVLNAGGAADAGVHGDGTMVVQEGARLVTGRDRMDQAVTQREQADRSVGEFFSTIPRKRI